MAAQRRLSAILHADVADVAAPGFLDMDVAVTARLRVNCSSLFGCGTQGADIE